MAVPEVESVFSVVGFSFAGSAPNQGLIFTLLKPFDERQRAGAAASRRCCRGCAAAVRHPGRARHPVRAAGDQGLGNFGGFTIEVLDQGGGADIENLGGARRRR